MSTLINDISYALRQLRKNPGSTAAALLTLPISIGGTTAIFGVMNAYILDSVPLKNKRRLIEINEIDRVRQRRTQVSPPLYQDLVQQRDLFEEEVSFQYDGMRIAGDEFLDYMPGSRATHNFFNLFEIPLLLGCWLTMREQEAAVEDVVVISHATWQSRLGGDPDVIGRELRSKDITYTIIGVRPAHFQFPSRRTQYWRPSRFHADEIADPGYRFTRNYYTFALLAPDISRFQVQAFLGMLVRRLARDFPHEWNNYAVHVRSLCDFFVAPEVQKTL